MEKQTRVFKKILYNNFVLIALILFVAVSFIAHLTYANYKERLYTDVQKNTDEYASIIKSKTNEIIQKSDYVVQDLVVIEGLKKESDSIIERIEFSNYITEFLNVISAIGEDVSISIYSTNRSLYENEYILYSDRLQAFDNIISELKEKGNSFMWKSMPSGEKQQIIFYREIFSGHSILTITMDIPEANYENTIIMLQNADCATKNDNIFACSEINAEFVVVSEIKQDPIVKERVKLLLIFSIVYICICLIVFYISYYVTHKVTSNIERFLLEIENSESDITEMSIPIDESDSHELVLIKNALKSLILEIQKRNKKQFVDAVEKNQLKFNLLQRKIDPHILYNTLSLVNLNAYAKKDFETVNIIDTLVSYYRLILCRGKDTSTIAEELQMIRNYIKLCELTNQTEYTLRIDISKDCEDVLVPHMIIQPFVENTVVHGLSGKKEDGIIEISVCAENDFIVITITDNGYGMDDITLDKLNNMNIEMDSYGIRNTYERLKIHYGDSSSIKFHSIRQKGTSVTIRFMHDMCVK